MEHDILIEIGTEELPPKSLKPLAEAFAGQILASLQQRHLSHAGIKWYATPRRLAVILRAVMGKQAEQVIQRRGPALKNAYDEDGKPTKAALGFAKSCNAEIDRLESSEGFLIHQTVKEGQLTTNLLPDMVTEALSRLPIPKRMRWGSHSFEFIRPVHWFVLLCDGEVIASEIFNISADCYSYGHRFLSPDKISLASHHHYVDTLFRAHVRVDYADRLHYIRTEIERIASRIGGKALITDSVLEENTALTEWPVVIKGEFDSQFLALPREVLIATLQTQQKYFPIVKGQELLPSFIAVSNLQADNMGTIIRGNERVIRSRLGDAQFFYQRDCEKELAERIDDLKKVVYQQQLGSLYDKSQRVQKLVGIIAVTLGIPTAEREAAIRAVELCKCDLTTEMVTAFPELQGIIGREYASKDKEAGLVCEAIGEHYQPQSAAASIPQTSVGRVLALADRLDTLSGLFIVGKRATGEKDPFGLRRTSLGILRILIEASISLDLKKLLADAYTLFALPSETQDVDTCFEFMMERLRHYYLDQGIDATSIHAVLAVKPTNPLDLHQRLQAINAFKSLPEASSLIMANKRAGNILKKANCEEAYTIDKKTLTIPAEVSLAKQLDKTRVRIQPMLEKADYTKALVELASMKPALDEFFEKVIVMSEIEAEKQNRLGLLQGVNTLFTSIADISCL